MTLINNLTHSAQNACLPGLGILPTFQFQYKRLAVPQYDCSDMYATITTICPLRGSANFSIHILLLYNGGYINFIVFLHKGIFIVN